ncbi:glycosyltransferase family 4 protein [bacterium]|nr:MAG: glycosyltransferase family 4 protein [bacterium]
MRIAIVSTLWEPVSYTSTGGTGAFVGYLTEELVKRNHDVTLFASGNSKTSAKLESITDTHFVNGFSDPLEYLNIANAFSKSSNFDIIHCNNSFRSLIFSDLIKTPSIHLLDYGELFDHEKKVIEKYKNTANFVTISKAMQKLIDVNWQEYIYHGIDLKRFLFNADKQDYLLFLARLTPQKGPDVAIRVAKKLGMKLILAGKKSDVDKKYLSEKVDPFIDNDQIKYIGEANFETKIELLKNAQCLLHPIDVNEAFGITLIEAMACGIPVISFDRGAISEVIEDKKTGFIVKTEGEMIDAIKNIDKISKEDCRKRVEENFTVEKMTDGYEKIYTEIIKQTKK